MIRIAVVLVLAGMLFFTSCGGKKGAGTRRPVPAPFSMTSPAAGAEKVSDSPEFTWKSSGNATRYVFQISRKPDFSELVRAEYRIESLSFRSPGKLDASTLYYWRVIAKNEVAETLAEGAPWSFRTADPPPKSFAMIAPADGAGPVSPQPSFEWEESAGAETYELEVSEKPDFSPVTVRTKGIRGARHILEKTLEDGRSYFWRVTAVGPGGETVAHDAPRHFRVGGYVLWAWGRNVEGQVGNGETSDALTPTRVRLESGEPVRNVARIAAGNFHLLVATTDGRLYTFGGNSAGQLGTGDLRNRTKPALVVDSTGASWAGVSDISAGVSHSLALRKDGTVWGWGQANGGQLGTFTGNEDPTRPLPIRGKDGVALSGITAISAGCWHNLALRADGTVLGWGRNLEGQLGGGALDRRELVPVVDEQGRPLTRVKSLAAAMTHSLALLQDGTLRAWGDNHNGQLGDGTRENRRSPVTVLDEARKPLSGVKAIASSGLHSLALLQDGRIFAWGKNDNGQLGTGNHQESVLAVRVMESPGHPLDQVSGIGIGGFHSLVRMSDGTTRAWGWNKHGQLGNNRTSESVDFPGLVIHSSGRPFVGVIHVASFAATTYVIAAEGNP